MYRFLATFLLLFAFQNLFGQVTFIVNELPKGHDFNESIYISGSFEGWSGGNEKYELTKVDEQYQITLSDIPCNILFKFTLGTWATVEMDLDGVAVENRSYSCEGGDDIVYVSIGSWTSESQNVVKSTAHKNVQILSEEFYIPQLDRTRRVWIYLPPDYQTANKKYPVLYMHDGQNIFDVKTSYAGEWEVDETLNRLFYDSGYGMIVVGIDNGEDKRTKEYIPYDNPRFKDVEGEAYAKFIVETLKPYIDKSYRTLPEKENTALFGSSLGGLITHYTTLQYPNIFGMAGVFSPSFWVSENAYENARKQSTLQDTRMFFLMGDKESEKAVPDMDRMINLMSDSGFNSKNIKRKVVEGGEHNEKLWKESFEEAILWLFEINKPVRTYEGFRKTYFAVEVDVSDGTYHILYYNSKIVETTFVPKGEKLEPISHAVVLTPDEMKHTLTMHGDVCFDQTKLEKNVEEHDEYLKIKTQGIEILVQKEPFQISYSYKGKPITSEKRGYHKTEYGEAIQLNLTEDEVLYGGGARALGMDRRGHRLQLYNRAHYGYETESKLMNYTMPIVLSSNQYMIHFDNAPIGYLDLDSRDDNTLTYETISGRKTYQVIVGDSWEDLIDNYTDLTGKQPIPPRWAFGNFSSRFGYHSQEETERTIAKFKEEQIPVDAVILDLYWFGKDVQGTMGNLEVFRDSFPDFEGMVKRLNDEGVKTVTITEPFVLTTSKRWEEAVKEDVLAKDSIGNPFTYDFYFGNTGLIDIYKPEGEQWFWEIYKNEIINKGVKGIWGDLGEPEVHPSDLIHATGTADEVHNIYGHDWARLVYEGYAKDFPNQRPFILMRAGYSGSQRYGMIPWSGDVNRTWGGLQSQMEIALQMSMQGLAYMHSDLGGFAGANLDDELYTRWLQYGVFNPIYRPHAQEDVPSEPVFRSYKAKALAKQSIELRYKLLPYNYTLAFENNQTGKPLMRPLFFEEPENKGQQENASTYLWGNDFLVTPIVNPDVEEKDVYFPKNNIWFDFYTDNQFAGGQTKIIATKVNSIPTYVRAGAFIPMAKLVQSTDKYVFNDFEMHYYFDPSVSSSKRSFYNDDGLTKDAYEKGNFEILNFESALLKHNKLQFDIDSKTGDKYHSSRKVFQLILHNWEKAPKYVKVNGRKLNCKYNSEKRTLSIPLNWDTAKELNLKIKLNK